MLITCDNWFVAPDGKMYKAVWGSVEVKQDNDLLGIKTNARSTNWYAVVGTGGKRVVLAGCQIHYACVCPDKPNTGRAEQQYISSTNDSEKILMRECILYIAE